MWDVLFSVPSYCREPLHAHPSRRGGSCRSHGSEEVRHLPALSRVAWDPLLPLGAKATGLQQLGEGLWCLRQDFLPLLPANIGLNSHVARLRGGGLLVVSPPARTEEAEALLASLPGGCGAVTHVVLPNLAPDHWIQAADWAACFAPDVTLWAAPGLLEARGGAGLLGAGRLRSSYPQAAELPVRGGPLPGPLGAEVEAATFVEGSGLFTESALFLRDHRAVTFTDAAVGVFEHPVGRGAGRRACQMAGIYRRLGSPLATPFLLKDPAAGRAWLQAVLGWDFDWVLPGHLDPMVGPEGKALVRECFGFLLQERQ